MLISFLTKLLVFGSVINISYCESDSEPADATSRIHFVQYQSTKGTPVSSSSSDNAVAAGELDSSRSDYYVSSEQPFPDHPEDRVSTIENQELSPVPKNYAFSYAIHDRKSGDDFSHMQAHNGEATKGEYRVKLPDGRVQIVTYTADNGGYRADIRYDKGETAPEKRTDDDADVARPQNNFSSGDRRATLNSANTQPSFNQVSDKTDSPLLYFNEIRTFDPPASSQPASYETVEHVDEEQFPYSKKLLSDVNYLLKYVTPTVETRTENVFDVTPDSKIFENRYFNARNGPSPQQLRKPYDWAQSEEAKFARPSSDSREYAKLNVSPLRPSRFNVSLAAESPRLGFSRAEGQFGSPKYNLDKLSQLLAKLEHRELQHSTQKHNSGIAPQYESQDVGRPQFGTPRYESKPAQPTSPGPLLSGYEAGPPRVPSTPRYELANIEMSSPLTLPRYQASERPYFVPHRYESAERGNAAKFQQQSYDSLQFVPPRQDAQPFESPRYENQRLNQIAVSLYGTPKFENQNSEGAPFISTPRQELSKFTSSAGPSKHSAQEFAPPQSVPKYRSQEYTSASPGSLKYVAQELTPLPPNSLTYSSQEFSQFTPNLQENAHHPQEYPSTSPVPANFASQEANAVTPTVPVFRPTPPTGEARRPVGDRHQFGKIEIPQYLHIHRYEDSGEDAKPKELIYYTPLQIPVPNSIAYIQRGHHNITDSRRPSFLPSYVTMTEHPRLFNGGLPAQFKENLFVPEYPRNYESANLTAKETGPEVSTPSVSSENFRNSEYDSGYSPAPPPAYKNEEHDSSPRTAEENVPSPPSVSQEQSNEDRSRYESGADDAPHFDARIYSGYFDFTPPEEVEGEKQKDDYQESRQNEPQNGEAPLNQNTPLPQYYYDFSTASPTHRYLSSEVGSEESNAIAGDQIRNSSFRASAYLRPLRKERVYIHHNSVPTPPSDERFDGPTTTPKPQHKTSDVSIVKSISSTIPPELLKDFDSQLRSVFRRDNYDVGNEIKETKVPAPTTRTPKINKILVKKLQSTLPTVGTVYLKTPSAQQKRIVR